MSPDGMRPHAGIATVAEMWPDALPPLTRSERRDGYGGYSSDDGGVGTAVAAVRYDRMMGRGRRRLIVLPQGTSGVADAGATSAATPTAAHRRVVVELPFAGGPPQPLSSAAPGAVAGATGPQPSSQALAALIALDEAGPGPAAYQPSHAYVQRSTGHGDMLFWRRASRSEGKDDDDDDAHAAAGGDELLLDTAAAHAAVAPRRNPAQPFGRGDRWPSPPEVKEGDELVLDVAAGEAALLRRGGRLLIPFGRQMARDDLDIGGRSGSDGLEGGTTAGDELALQVAGRSGGAAPARSGRGLAVDMARQSGREAVPAAAAATAGTMHEGDELLLEAASALTLLKRRLAAPVDMIRQRGRGGDEGDSLAAAMVEAGMDAVAMQAARGMARWDRIVAASYTAAAAVTSADIGGGGGGSSGAVDMRSMVGRDDNAVAVPPTLMHDLHDG